MFGKLCFVAAKCVRSILTAIVLASALVGVAHADEYPSRPVKIVVPVSPGGPMDMIARLVGEKLGEMMGENFLVENMPGGGHAIATNSVAKSKPDGYTLLVMSHVHTMNPWLFSNLPYKVHDLRPITLMTVTPLILSVNPDLPVHTVQDLLDYAKAHPGELSFGSSGPSSSLRFAAELLMFMTDIKMEHIPYKGNGPMTVAVAANEVDLGFVNPVSLPFIKDGSLRALAITSKERKESLPDLPTVAETVPGFVAGSWFGMMAPTDTPDDIVNKLNVAINKILDMPDVKDRLANVEATPSGDTVDEFSAMVESELKKWQKLIEKTGLKIK